MGAYYTKEDITGYIGKNTILPFLFESARKECRIAFEPEGEVWRLLRDDPDRYIYEAVRTGVDLELPPAIAAGIDDVAQRGGWNRPAALATPCPPRPGASMSPGARAASICARSWPTASYTRSTT